MAVTAVLGRRAELDRVAGVANDVRGGPAAVVLVRGPAGVGKTALVDEAVGVLGASGWRVARASLSETETSLSWAGLHLLCDDLDATGVLPPGLREALDAALGRGAPTSADPGQVAFALARLLATWAERTPLALLVDDLHWLDRATAGALAFAIRANAARPVLTVLSARSDEPAPLDPERLLPGGCHDLRLAGLPAAATGLLLAQRCGVRLGAPDVRRIHEVTDGAPLHVIEVGRLIAEGRDVSDALIPPSAEATIAVRRDALPAEVLTTLRLAALLARPTVALVRAALAAAEEPADVAAALELAEEEGIAAARNGRVEFGHPLMRAAILDGMTRVERRRRQRQLAALVTDPDERALLLAAAAVEPDPTLAADLAAAAERALEVAAPDLAAERFELAARMVPADDRTARGRLLMRAANAADDAGSSDRSIALLDLAEPLVDDPADRVEITMLRSVLAARRGEYAEAARIGTSLLARPGLTTADRVRLRRLLAQYVAYADLDAAVGHVEAGLAEDPSSLGLALLRDRLYLLTGRPIDLDALPRDGEHLAVISWVAELLTWVQRTPEALEFTTRMLDAARASGHHHVILSALANLGDTELRAGRWDEALVHLAELDELDGFPGGEGHMTRAIDVATILASRGQVDEALRRLDEAFVTPDLPPIDQVQTHGRACHVQVCLADWQRAVEHGRRARTIAAQIGYRDVGGVPFRADLVEALLAVGAVDEADDVATEHHELAARAGYERGRGDAARSRGLVAAARGDLAAAGALLELAAGLHRDGGFPLEHGRDLLALGVVQRRGGRRSQAGASLAQARGVFDALGATTWTARVDAETARIGSRRSAHAGALTPTEARIAERVAAGRTNAEVAGELSVSVRTVESNLTRIYRKLGVRSRTGLVGALTRATGPT